VNTSSGDHAPLLFLIAGEPSGDDLGGRLMAALKVLCGGEVRFTGIGGSRMSEQGLSSLFPMTELSIMGLAELIPHLPRLSRRLTQTVKEISAQRPAAVITIDSPGFNFRVAKRLKNAGIPLIHYVAPSVWAWRPDRARAVAGFLDHLLALLPFEPPYFEAEGLPCTFVGHPVVESGANKGDGDAFCQRHGITGDDPVICVLPGSRRGETARLLPLFGATLGLLMRARPRLRAVVPTVAGVVDEVSRVAREWPVPALVVEGESEKFSGFAASDVALAASGTVALELALARVPAVIAYRVNPLTAWLARRLIRVPYANLVNIILEREVVPEFIQGDCRPQLLAPAIERLLDGVGAAQTEASAEALRLIGYGGPSPSERAARAVLDVVSRYPQKHTEKAV
jgi:lipid-A-disaccharide synthase